jgi:predicted dehydrogenase
MLKVAIIGCGKIADEHAAAVQLLPDCEICGVCDSEELMAGQLAERLGIKGSFTDAGRLLEVTRPDVVHITTPPQSHFPLAKLCIEAGSNVFVEKPFTVTAREAEQLIRLAEEKHVKLTVGHNNQFNPVAIRMRALINAGFLGGDPIHMESIFSYDMSDGYARTLLADKDHWVRGLPGQLLHNVISHGVCKIAEFLHSDDPLVLVHGFQSPRLRAAGESDLVDELRVIIAERGGATAYFTFSTQITPARHEFRIFGPKNYLVADHTHQTLIHGLNKSYKIQLNSFVPPFLYAKQYLANGWSNIGGFVRRKFHIDAGRRVLLTSFYGSISEDRPVPVSYHEILLTAKIMDSIFAQLYKAVPHKAGANRLSEQLQLTTA